MTGHPLQPGDFADRLLDHVPELSRLASIQVHIECNLDSTNLGPAQWAGLASRVSEYRDRVDGFVIIHGTDTMAYTAGALSYALRGLDKPVVLTGAQLPLVALRSDARPNLADAVQVAGMNLAEVMICFDGLLLRGCRSVKNDARSYRAFASPGVSPLATLGIGVDVAMHVRRPQVPFHCDPRFDPGVSVVMVHPGLGPEVFNSMLDSGRVRGVVLAALGVGNIPRTNPEVLRSITRLIERGVLVVAVTQWGGGVDLSAYDTGRALADIGVISGGRMRVEAALPKVMHALATCSDADAQKAYITTDIAGEYA